MTPIVPRLPGARTLDSQVLGPAAVLVRWRMGDGATLAMAANLGPEPAAIASPGGKLLFATSDKAIAGGTLAAPQHRRLPRARAVNDETILAQARKAGIAIDWTDANGQPQRVSVGVTEAHPGRAGRQRASAASASGDSDSRSAHRHRRRRTGRARARGRFAPVAHPAVGGPADRHARLPHAALRRSRGHDRRGAAALRHDRRHRTRAKALGHRRPALQPEARRRRRHRRHDGLGHARAGSGEAGRRCHRAQPDAQPLPRRCDPLRSLLAIQPAVPQSAADRSGHHAGRASRGSRDRTRSAPDRLAERGATEVRPAAPAVRRLRHEQFLARAGIRRLHSATAARASPAISPSRPATAAIRATTPSCNGWPTARSPRRRRRPRTPACGSA